MLKYTALITQSIDCASARSGEGSSTPSSSALCTQPVRPSPPSPSRETCRGVSVRPQLVSSAVFSCLLHRRVIRTPHPHTRAHGMWVTHASGTPRGRAVGGGGAPDHRRSSQRRKAPPPRDALLPPPHRATPARKGARCGAGAGSPRPHGPRPGHTGRGAPAAGSRGRAAGRGTAPDTRHPWQRWQATPPGTAPHHPRGTQPPQGMQAKGTVLGPDTHTPAPTARGWRTSTARPVGGQSGEGQRLTSDAPHNSGRQPPPGDALPPPP